MYCSSCNYLCFCHILPPLLALSSVRAYLRQDGVPWNRWATKEQWMRPKKRELHELPYTKIIKSGTFRLAFWTAHVVRVTCEIAKTRTGRFELLKNKLWMKLSQDFPHVLSIILSHPSTTQKRFCSFFNFVVSKLKE